ncbi:MAG: hypothetical protein EOM20_12615 [Spartobacteria bacterium]|nr:hypothetical protein [Spartobacteria bacterium]
MTMSYADDALAGRGCRWAVYVALAGLFLLPGSMMLQAEKGPYDWALVRLDYVRADKVAQLEHFCRRVRELAAKAAGDPSLYDCFRINREYDRLCKHSVPPGEVREKIMMLREELGTYYLEHYLTFYDILFVDVSGEVFYTIRNESDMHNNLMDKDSPTFGPLGVALQAQPAEECFVDFHDYGPSSEPASFFVEPVMEDGELVGWIVLQCAINKVNSLFAWTEELGQSGETILVNGEGFMLSESNFEGSSTILSKRLDDRNIKTKFEERRGHRLVTDYRGFSALTSFEVVPFMGTEWLVVAKVDRDEILTSHYADHRRYSADRLVEYFRKAPSAPSISVPDAVRDLYGCCTRVDIDEFLKAEEGRRLHTFGVATCTGLLAVYPGKFAYMAHISPRDKMYGSDDVNLLGQLIKRIQNFDMYPCEQRKVMFLVVAPHLESLPRIVDKLVDEGFMLSQIQVLVNQAAETAELMYDPDADEMLVYWRNAVDDPHPRIHSLREAANVGRVFQEIFNLSESGFPEQVRVPGNHEQEQTTEGAAS